MTDNTPKHDRDDELLSAYLDGELSPEERAAIEARLAADPAAQRLLHEFRSVSQSVHALPQESLGRDLSEVIVRRAQQARPAIATSAPSKTTVADGRPSHLGGELPKITIFGSRRTWFWASLALAAGLFIMFTQPGDEKVNKTLPPVAQRDREIVSNNPVREPAQRALSEPGISAPPESAPPASAVATDQRTLDKASAPAASMPAQQSGESIDAAKQISPAGPPLAAASPAMKGDDIGLSLNAGSTATASPAAPPPSDSLAVPPQTVGRASASGSALSRSLAQEESKRIGHEIPLVVVHVLAKPDAIQKKAFDQLLASHDISVEQQSAKDHSSALVGSLVAKQAEGEFAAGNLSDNSTAGEKVDVLFVEAPRAAIISCLNDLQQDSSNYLGIKVDERSNPGNRALPMKSGKKLSTA